MRSRVTEKVRRLVSTLGLSSRTHEEVVLPHGNKKHIVVLSQFYRPEPSRYPADIAEKLDEAGFKVSVVTGFPNRPGGELHSGYRQKFGFSEMINGIRIHRVPLIINHSRKALERIGNFLSFSVTALTLTSVAKKADAIYVYATPATAAIPAQIWRKLFGTPYVLHVQDLWPESVTESGMMGTGVLNRAASAFMKPWLKSLYRNAESLIAISPGMRELLVERGNEARTCSVVFNWADETTVTPKPSESFLEDSVRLLYAGNMGPMQDLETVIEAARQFENKNTFRLTFAGSGVLEETLRSSAAGLERVHFAGRLPRSQVSQLYLESDFQLVTLKDIPIFRTTVPSKLQSSLAAGVPVITTVTGDVANLINRYEAGLVAEPENIESLADVFAQALSMSTEERARMGTNARRLYLDFMSQAAGESSIATIMGEVSSRNPDLRASDSDSSVLEN